MNMRKTYNPRRVIRSPLFNMCMGSWVDKMETCERNETTVNDTDEGASYMDLFAYDVKIQTSTRNKLQKLLHESLARSKATGLK